MTVILTVKLARLLKVTKHSEHERETCATCISSSSVGDQVFSPTNPNYVCIFDNFDWDLLPPNYPHPFPLTGEGREEKLLTVLQRILLKMKVTEHPVYQQRREQVDLLEERMWDVRGQMYVDRIYFGGHDPMTLRVLNSGVFWMEVPENPSRRA